MRGAVLVLVAAATVHAQPAPNNRAHVSQALQKIAQLEQQLEYEQALVLADRTIAEGVATRDQLADLHLIAGRLAAGLDHADIAQQHFAKVLALRPDTSLVAGTSPKLLAPFEAAKQAPHDLVVGAHVEAGRVVATVASDSLHLVAGLRVAMGLGGEPTPPVFQIVHGLAMAIPAGAHVKYVAFIDEAGNELALVELSAPYLWDHGTLVTHRSRAWIPWAAASGATLIAGGLFAWRYGVAQDEWNRENDGMHDYTRLHALEDRGQRWAIAADVGFGLAAATAITAAILFATGSSSERLGVAITGNSAGVVAYF